MVKKRDFNQQFLSDSYLLDLSSNFTITMSFKSKRLVFRTVKESFLYAEYRLAQNTTKYGYRFRYIL